MEQPSPTLQVNREHILECLRQLEETYEQVGMVQLQLKVSEQLPKEFQTRFQVNTDVIRSVRDDLVFFTKDLNYFSCSKKDGYYSYSERLKEYGLTLENIDEKGRVLIDKNHTISYAEAVGRLLGKAKAPCDSASWGGMQFLSGENFTNQISYATFPRSGNTFLRTYFEKISGVRVGSEFAPVIYPDLQQQLHGFFGEGHFDNHVWFVKTHCPYYNTSSVVHQVKKVVVQVRNPRDVLASLFNFSLTFSNNKPIKESNFLEILPAQWKEFVEHETVLWKNFHQYWIEKARSPEYLVYFCRFEDLEKTPYESLVDFFKFVLDLESLQGLEVEQRIKKVVEEANLTHYKPRQKEDNSLLYSEDMREYMKSQLRETLVFFGYEDIFKMEYEKAAGKFDFKQNNLEKLACSLKNEGILEITMNIQEALRLESTCYSYFFQGIDDFQITLRD